MTRHTTAGKHARALLDVAIRDGDPDRVERELTAFEALLTTHADLSAALLRPGVPPLRKRALVAAILSRQGASASVGGRLLLGLAERDRLTLLPALLEAYRERLLEHRQVVRAEVTTAVALGPEQALALTEGLERATGKQVSLETRVDPSIIGGVVARIGSIVYDASVARQLARLEERLGADVS